MPSGTSLLDLYDEQIVTILSQLDIRSLTLVRQSCHILHWYGLFVLNMRYDAILAPYVSVPNHFRRLLDVRNAFIGGSTALHFFLVPIEWKPNGLDIFVRIDAVVSFLNFFHLEGYKRVVPWEENVLPARQLPCTEASLKLVRGPRSVNIIIATLENPLDPIMHTWSTVVMNALAGSRAICAYPLRTINNEALITRPLTIALQWPSISDERRKYESRNFQFVENRTHPHPPSTCRRVGDERCLVVNFEGFARKPFSFWRYRERWFRGATNHTVTTLWYEHYN
ncbi:hypothetical protein NLI96_g5387 [Meripilus lineatus]|uniref:F-box domain-containing protein n=1 Tax=Meripilus lineatus TaxID=2056292 RepID=A0AAD5V349_9APHY|nr:hypothetical protein NLI96_g5387 [Physisporinus lineatus]